MMVAVRRLELEYHHAARMGDRLTVESWVEKIGRTSVQVGQNLKRGDGALLCEASVIGVFVSPAFRPIPVPDELRAAFPDDALGRPA